MTRQKMISNMEAWLDEMEPILKQFHKFGLLRSYIKKHKSAVIKIAAVKTAHDKVLNLRENVWKNYVKHLTQVLDSILDYYNMMGFKHMVEQDLRKEADQTVKDALDSSKWPSPKSSDKYDDQQIKERKKIIRKALLEDTDIDEALKEAGYVENV